jgi:hypothetical protein
MRGRTIDGRQAPATEGAGVLFVASARLIRRTRKRRRYSPLVVASAAKRAPF